MDAPLDHLAEIDGLLLDELCAGTVEFPRHARTLIRAMLAATAATAAALPAPGGTPPTSRS